MALEPITRQEKIIAGQDLTPITRMEMFLKDFGGGGGGAQPDLSQTDTTKPDYVKGVIRQESLPEGYPYKEQSEHTITVTVTEEALSIDRDGVSETIPVADVDALLVNNNYLRIADPIDQDAIKTMFINNCHVSEVWDFMMQNGLITDDYVAFEDWMCTYKDGVTDSTIGTWPTAGFYVDIKGIIYGCPIEWIEKTIHPMAEEFLPNIPADKLPAADALYLKSSTADSTKKFKITVDDSGTISATAVT